MKQISKCLLMLVMLFMTAVVASGQSMKTHKVKKDETIYGIARSYGLTEQELRNANPGMENPSYVLKKGDKIFIPVPGAAKQQPVRPAAEDVRQRAIRMGVMLPLHDNNGEGRRMIEYYRGLLLACDSLKSEGISVDVYAWNTPSDANISEILAKPEAAACDIIFGPLYSKQMEPLSSFCSQHAIKLVIPFSISAPQLAYNSNIFQVYQAPENMNETVARRLADWFGESHIVIVDCDNPGNPKGAFTSALRQLLDSRNRKYRLTSLKSPSASFASAFDAGKHNVVVLNSGRTSDMEEAFVKLKDFRSSNPGVRVSLIGYTEWMEQAESHQQSFHRYDMYIPSPSYFPLAPITAKRIGAKYRSSFHQDMMKFYPPLAFTGFDHALFFLRGLHKYGHTFKGDANSFGYVPVQTPLKFEPVTAGGGYQNRGFMFVHYKTDGQVETINY